MSSRTNTVLTIAGISLCGIIAYAVYFDYRRRTDPEFRKKIRKEKKRVDKSLAQSREALAAATEVSEAELREALKMIKTEPRPASQSDRENYFMSQVAMGEQLAARGEPFHLPAALSFYRALSVYPSPPELLSIYQKTVPDAIVKIILALVNLDVSSSPVQDLGIDDVGDASPTRGPPSETSSQEWDKIGAYEEVFPPKSTNVTLQTRPPNSETSGPEKVLVLTKDVAAGEIIYKEYPMLTCLDYDLQLSGHYCTHCMREIQPSLGSLSLLSSDSTKFAFCSKPCQVASKSQWFSLLFTLDPPLPAVLELSHLKPTPAALEARRAAQVQLLAYLNKDKRVGPLLMTKFIARQLTAANGKAPGKDAGDYTEADSGEYQIEDHVERWSSTPIEPPSEEYSLVVALLKATLPGLDAFISEESHVSLLGRIAFNGFGVCFGGGRDDRPPSTLRPEDAELTRTPYGTTRQVGTALYSVSTYLSHSCTPNARPSFSSGTSELHLIANKDLKKGDALSIAYVDVSQRPGESVVECRQRRRKELARGWKFACQCSRCLKEASEK
ncbi:SET domain-containing protein [Mycena venus]|uniref:SET domain-containing protein n=1 Tax=Mycena venus TaxID=2733690 RepID=A0A8H7CY18_9AGAR|nr:SET domain-containing protein [Mycena venus]